MKKNYEAYKTLDKKVDHLFDSENYKEAITMLENSYGQFPEYDLELKTYALYCCREDKNYVKCLELLQEGLSKGYFYGLKWDSWNPLRSLSGWKEIEEKNALIRAEVQKNSKMEYKVFLPENYDKNKQYPLFITLHGDGNGCNIEDFSQDWKPDPLLKRGFIAAYVQSSQP